MNFAYLVRIPEFIGLLMIIKWTIQSTLYFKNKITETKSTFKVLVHSVRDACSWLISGAKGFIGR